MKILVILFLFLNVFVFGQKQIFNGNVIDVGTDKPLANANIILIGETTTGTFTNENGDFTILREFKEGDKLIITYVGYEDRNITFEDIPKLQSKTTEDGKTIFLFYLSSKILSSQTILVEATVGKQGITPITFDQIKQKEIEKIYTIYDIPKYLSDLPSTTFYSEGGNAIGYNYISIRGFDQRRISVSINGIPQNDPEDHNVYWLDFPDLLASTELIQVQRGAGSGVFGYPAIGGSINIITSSFSNKPKLELSASYGSYVTRKYSVAFSSGLIDNKYSVYAKLGQILSSGYKDLTWVNFKSYFLSAVRYDKDFTTQFNFYGGPVADGLGYTGVAKFAVKDRNLRRQNFSFWEADDDQYTFTLERKPEEIENFSQPHFELLNEWQINNDLKFNSALFLIKGDGFFDFDGSWSVFIDDYFRLKENGFDKRVSGAFVFVLSGVLGLIVLGWPNLKQPLFPMLSGLFGVSTLLMSLTQKVSLPKQKITDTVKIPRLNAIKAVLAAVFSGSLTGIFPGLGAAQAAIIALSLVGHIGMYSFMILIGGINTVNFVFSLVTFYTLEKARNGAVVAVMEVLKTIDASGLIIFLGAALLAGGISAYLALVIAKVFSKYMEKVNYHRLISGVIIFITVLVAYFSGLVGLMVLFTSTAIGMLAPLLNVKRSNAMGCLLLPVILFFIL
ncbi:MAG: tripartite tricarboxylate transporter permease [Bacteroidetes bacterium]|nr:tripartite tricarboxylate transporter permease [Bacteroidota bacterium]